MEPQQKQKNNEKKILNKNQAGQKKQTNITALLLAVLQGKQNQQHQPNAPTKSSSS